MHTEWLRREGRDMLLAGATCAEVARRLGVPLATVKRWYRKLQQQERQRQSR